MGKPRHCVSGNWISLETGPCLEDMASHYKLATSGMAEAGYLCVTYSASCIIKKHEAVFNSDERTKQFSYAFVTGTKM